MPNQITLEYEKIRKSFKIITPRAKNCTIYNTRLKTQRKGKVLIYYLCQVNTLCQQ